MSKEEVEGMVSIYELHFKDYDYKTLEKIVKGISYNNAVRYFEFNV